MLLNPFLCPNLVRLLVIISSIAETLRLQPDLESEAIQAMRGVFVGTTFIQSMSEPISAMAMQEKHKTFVLKNMQQLGWKDTANSSAQLQLFPSFNGRFIQTTSTKRPTTKRVQYTVEGVDAVSPSKKKSKGKNVNKKQCEL
jgi:hypothetical protein